MYKFFLFPKMGTCCWCQHFLGFLVPQKIMQICINIRGKLFGGFKPLKSFIQFCINILLEFYKNCKEGIQYKILIRFKTLWTSTIQKLGLGESKRRHKMPTIVCPASQTSQISFLFCSIPLLQASQELFISFCNEFINCKQCRWKRHNQDWGDKESKISDESGGGGDDKEGKRL